MSVNMGLSFFDKNIKIFLLRWKMKRNFINTDIVSAESKNSLKILKNNNIKFFFLSTNGSDNELNYLQNNFITKKEDIAVVVGTQRYKSLIEAYKIFKILKKKNNFLKLVLIGDHNNIHKHFINNNEIIIKGEIKQNQVIKILKRAKYYISTTKIENSFNAASEGIFFADESYISDIGPHRELLENEKYNILTIPTLKSKVLNVKRKNLKGKNLKSWNGIILEMIKKINNLNYLSNKQ
jgi:glycosyltransferase involved in cell wall biosynthesis